jgi:hypothetical protein
MCNELATVTERINVLLARIERGDYPDRARLEDTLTGLPPVVPATTTPSPSPGSCCAMNASARTKPGASWSPPGRSLRTRRGRL